MFLVNEFLGRNERRLVLRPSRSSIILRKLLKAENSFVLKLNETFDLMACIEIDEGTKNSTSESDEKKINESKFESGLSKHINLL